MILDVDRIQLRKTSFVIYGVLLWYAHPYHHRQSLKLEGLSASIVMLTYPSPQFHPLLNAISNGSEHSLWLHGSLRLPSLTLSEAVFPTQRITDPTFLGDPDPVFQTLRLDFE